MRPARRVPLPLALGFLAFVLVLGLLVAQSFAPRRVPEFPPREPTQPATSTSQGPDTLTIDARDARRWRFVDLDRRIVLHPPDTTGWDLAVRRYSVVPAGWAADLGPVPLDAPLVAAADKFTATTYARDTLNPATARWYRYGFLSHLLTSKGHSYAIRTDRGAIVRLQVVSYYCPGTIAGCVTVAVAE